MRIPDHIVTRATLALWATTIAGCTLIPAGGGVGRDNQRDSVGASVVQVLELRVHAVESEEGAPFMSLQTTGTTARSAGSDQITVTFDLRADVYPNLALNLVHCDRYWRPTENIFVQDPARLRTYDFDIRRAPLGVRGYDYQCSITFPRSGSRIRIEHSGNYLAQIVDYDEPTRVYGQGRFFVVEAKSSVEAGVVSDFFESQQTETPQHGLRIRVEAEPSVDIFGSQIAAIAIVESGQWYTAISTGEEAGRSDVTLGRPWVEWYPSFAGKVVAEFRNLPSGNEHRILDLGDVTLYPTIAAPVSTPLSDLPRRDFSRYDNNGIAASRLVPSGDEDYVDFEFRLDLLGREVVEDIVVVGTFTNWETRREWTLRYDTVTRYYVARGWLRRAAHEYEYRSGKWDTDKSEFLNEDATLLEGNLRQTTRLYYALVYYRETSAGGYDRIVGIGATISGTP